MSCFMNTHDEHTWHGQQNRPVHSPRISHSNQSFRGTFSIGAYKTGSLKSSVIDTINDKTVTQFCDAQPSVEQLLSAQEGYNNLALPWNAYVRGENEYQHRALYRRAGQPMIRSGPRAATLPSKRFGGLPTRTIKCVTGSGSPGPARSRNPQPELS